jgi:hypothetical protein
VRLAAFPIFVVFAEIKLHVEERLMLAEFPDEYPATQQAGAPAGRRPAPGPQNKYRISPILQNK